MKNQRFSAIFVETLEEIFGNELSQMILALIEQDTNKKTDNLTKRETIIQLQILFGKEASKPIIKRLNQKQNAN